jgi:squalene cyclase
VKIIVNSQNKDGGWRYQPVRADADVSVTVCEIMALRAARNAGLFVPNETIDRSIDYIKRSQNADGGFTYMIQGGESAFPRSAAAVTALYSAGVYQGPEIAKGLDYLMQFLPSEGVTRRESYYFYGQYYAAQAMWQAGGRHWNRWYPAIRDELVNRQHDDGSWLDPVGNQCATAMALLVLQMPNNYLPIFQR